MPHIVLEYAAGVAARADLPRLLQALLDTAATTGVMRAEDIKIRAQPFADFLLGDGGADFVHVTVRLLAGRSAAQKRDLGEALRACLTRSLPAVHSLSVDIVDMDPEAYLKRLL